MRTPGSQDPPFPTTIEQGQPSEGEAEASMSAEATELGRLSEVFTQEEIGVLTERQREITEVESVVAPLRDRMAAIEEQTGVVGLPDRLKVLAGNLENTKSDLVFVLEVAEKRAQGEDIDPEVESRARNTLSNLRSHTSLRRDLVSHEAELEAPRIAGFEDLSFGKEIAEGLKDLEMTPEDIFKEMVRLFPPELVSDVDHIVYERNPQPSLQVVSSSNPICAGGSFMAGTLTINRPTGEETFTPQRLLELLTHEIGHSNDLRLRDWQGVSLEEQLTAIEEWEELRGKEVTFSRYAEQYVGVASRIPKSAPGRSLLESIASNEDFAEAFCYHLLFPEYLKSQAPLRYAYMEKWSRKRFSNWDELIAKFKENQRGLDALLEYAAPPK